MSYHILGYVYFTFELIQMPPTRISNWPNEKEPKFTSIACGQNHALAISSSGGEVYSWGRGLAGNYLLKLGRGQPQSPQYPDLMICSGLDGRKPILAAGGSNHSFLLVV